LIPNCWLTSAARVLKSYLRSVSQTVSVRVLLEDEAVLKGFDTDDSADSLGEKLLSSNTALLPLWNAHSLLLISSYLSSTVISRAARRFEAVADDSLGGQLTQALYKQILLHGRSLSFRSAECRLEGLRTIMDLKPPLIMAADSHGPYRHIGSGMARLARHYGGLVRPLSVVCNRAAHIFPRIQMAVPRRNSRIVVLFGAPLEPSTSTSATGRSLQMALISLESRASSVIRNGESVAPIHG
jgi:hypothetical protein